MTTPANPPADPLAEFSVSANSDGEMTLDHCPDDRTRRWCFHEQDIKYGTTLPELIILARQHLADEDRECLQERPKVGRPGFREEWKPT